MRLTMTLLIKDEVGIIADNIHIHGSLDLDIIRKYRVAKDVIHPIVERCND